MKVDKALCLETPELSLTRREWESLYKLWNKLRKDIEGWECTDANFDLPAWYDLALEC